MGKSVKQKRLEGIILREISDIIQFEVKDASVGFVTVTGIDVSNDHSYAKVYVTSFGDENALQTSVDALNRAKGFIRTELAQRLSTRRVPELTFVVDETAKNGAKIEEILDQIHQDEGNDEEKEEE